MIEHYEKKRIKLNTPLKEYGVGTELTIRVDKKGTPVDRYWRDRLKDSKKDGCIEFVAASKPVETKADKSKTISKKTEEV